MQDNIAILIFSRTSKKEILYKNFAGNASDNMAICNNLYSQTFKTASKTNLPIIYCSEEQQLGNTFAEKITTAIASGFSKGYKNLIIIGTDCPTITKKIINIAVIKLLEGKDIVAGQDCRGGIYLLGINKNAFIENAFLHFNWQTRNLFKSILSYSCPYNFCKLKPVLFDINSKADILKSISLITLNISFKKLLAQVFTFFKSILIQNLLFAQPSIFTCTKILRGPPSFTK